MQQDGKIVLAGQSSDDPSTDPKKFAIARYDTSGALDTTFDGDGIVTTSITSFTDGQGNAGARAVSLQADGKIIAAGAAPDGTNYSVAVTRFCA